MVSASMLLAPKKAGCLTVQVIPDLAPDCRPACDGRVVCLSALRQMGHWPAKAANATCMSLAAVACHVAKRLTRMLLMMPVVTIQC